jgi:hypothetical protein
MPPKKGVPGVRKRNRETDLKVPNQKDIFLREYASLTNAEAVPPEFSSFFGDIVFEHMYKKLLAHVLFHIVTGSFSNSSIENAMQSVLRQEDINKVGVREGFYFSYMSYHNYALKTLSYSG